MNHPIDAIGWQFDNSYLTLPEIFYQHTQPKQAADPRLVLCNHAYATQLGLTTDDCSAQALAQLFSGNAIPQGAEPISQAYAGHQFGHFTMLGDGRAHLLGEHLTPDGTRVDIQLKGSGHTPFARRGDGLAALAPMLREYIISEAMHALGVPTTRSLAVVTTGEPVMRETMLHGAVLTRTAASHIRVGTFEYAVMQGDKDAVQSLADYVIERHFPKLKESKQPYHDMFDAVMERQIALVVHWLRVGFIHGVMNTDNMAISGETIDYGPCAFMDTYDPQTVFSSIDHGRRYAYANQPHIAQWNLARFIETILPLLHSDMEQAATIAQTMVGRFNARFQTQWLAMMRQKLGMFGEYQEDASLIGDVLQLMQRHQMDYTNTFRALASPSLPEGEPYHLKAFKAWWERWQTRLQKNNTPFEESITLMNATNPAMIPRNHRVEAALSAAQEHGDYSLCNSLLEALSTPYQDPQDSHLQAPPKADERVYQTFCGT